MARRKSAAALQKELDYAKRREAYKRPDKPDGGAIQRRPKSPVKYNSTGAAKAFTLQASKEGIQFFGSVGTLGLADAADDPTPPKGFKPNRILATVGDATPTRITAENSGRKYIRYARGARGSTVQSSFSAPLSSTGATATTTEVRTKFKTVADSIKNKLGGAYGRTWFESERLLMVESGE